MRKTPLYRVILLLCIFALLAALLTACAETVIGPVPGVTMVIEAADSKNISFFLKNETENEYTYGDPYILYVKQDDAWEPFPTRMKAYFHAIGYNLSPNSQTNVITENWYGLYGELPAGEYRFQKDLWYIHSSDGYEEYIVEQDFSLQ